MNSEGYIKIDRKMVKWEHYKDGNVLRVFLDLMFAARTIETKKNGKTVAAGTVLTTINEIRERTGIKSKVTVIDALNILVTSGEISKERSGNETIITINKFLTYQGGTKNEPPKKQGGTKNDTTEVQKMNHRGSKNEPPLIGINNSLNIEELLKNKKEPSIYAGGAKIGYEKFGQDGLVELKPSEYRTLIEQNTEDDVKAVIEDLNDKLAIGADDELINSKSHYHVLRYWLRCRKDKQAAQPKKTAWKVDLNALKI